jgi:hypothetical protein
LIFEYLLDVTGLANAGTPNLIACGLVFKDQNPGLDFGKPVVVAGRVRVLPPQQ